MDHCRERLPHTNIIAGLLTQTSRGVTVKVAFSETRIVLQEPQMKPKPGKTGSCDGEETAIGKKMAIE